MIAALVIATCAVIFVTTMGNRPTYQATARIMPSDAVLQKPILWSVATNGGPEQPMRQADTGGQLANLMSLVKSRAVAERTIQMLRLDMTPDDLQKQITVDMSPNPASSERAARDMTDIIQIAVTDADKDRAVRIANTTAIVFSNYYQEVSHQQSTSNSRFLDEQLARAQSSLDTAEGKLKSYKQTTGIGATPEGMTATIQSLKAIQQERDQAAALAAEAQQKFSNVSGQLRHEAPTRTVQEGTTNSPAVQELETQAAAIQTKLTDAQAKYYDVHPIVQDLKKSLADTKARLETERSKVQMHRNVVANPVYQTLLAQKSQYESDARGLAARVSQLDAAVARAQSGLKPGDDVGLAKFQQEFLDAQTLVSSLKLKLNQAKLDQNDTSETGAIRLVDRAISAEGPIGRSRGGFLVLGFLLSLLVGVGAALTMESLDNRIKSNIDVEQLLSLPVNALIPSMTGQDTPTLPKITYLDPLSPLAEAYRFLRTDLLLSAAECGAKTIMVATAKPGQGGTTTIANLAISLAMDGKRVVLVDADMRRPTLHRIFKAKNDFGLSNVLTGKMKVEEALVSTEIENLILLPAGATPTNSSELLGSMRMGEVVAQLANGADFVLFDTPSAIAFTDTVVLSKWLDGVLLVIRANQVPRGAELQVRKLFNKANVHILGVVLNDVQPSSVDSYYYHSHYYASPGSSTLALTSGQSEDTD